MAPTTRSKAAQMTATQSDSFAQSASDFNLSGSSSSTTPTPSPHARFSRDVAAEDNSFFSPLEEIVPPVYTIDLSLPPTQRYVQVAQDYTFVIGDLTELIDELLEEAGLPNKISHFLAKCVLRKLYSKEQTEELRGIGKVTGVPMYLLIAYNVLLDLLMGCTSGGVLVKEPRSKQGKMLHFRTLDWAMPRLRKAVVQFEFKNGPHGNIIARSVNYVGFVGTFTGVRKGLSVSLNYRPYHNDDHSKQANFKFYGHLLMVLLGWRPTICAHLRDSILPTEKELKRRTDEIKKRRKDGIKIKFEETYEYTHATLADIAQNMPKVPTTAAYLTFCDGSQTLILEKDRVTAKALLSSHFLAVTNHDTSYEPISSDPASFNSSTSAQKERAAHAKTHRIGMDELIDESMSRKGCLTAAWAERLRRLKREEGEAQEGYVEFEELKTWLLEYPVVNEQTNYAVVLDPRLGEVAWCRMWEEGDIRGDSNDEDYGAEGSGRNENFSDGVSGNGVWGWVRGMWS
ncbi:hypothetical protein K504DRAFT_459882 [Pleomassaria siparia CBS 279.74]|uniref:ceramidase n=1 Tax=Pleomassaria siparia CBS 279.74 TaxID=1314801 RepID=A0A6G1JZ72_9PLEO|nr:hypothetical protein K504DRAFT_459882 [Pleomassaria siparia CBS 279.74]